MKVHFFDKDGNFLKSDEMEELRIRRRLVVPEQMEPTMENAPSVRMKHRVFGAIPIHPGDGSIRPLFYLYLEVPK